MGLCVSYRFERKNYSLTRGHPLASLEEGAPLHYRVGALNVGGKVYPKKEFKVPKGTTLEDYPREVARALAEARKYHTTQESAFMKYQGLDRQVSSTESMRDMHMRIAMVRDLSAHNSCYGRIFLRSPANARSTTHRDYGPFS